MSEDTKKVLQNQLWNIAQTLRGKMGPDEFRDYILGFIFYKYLSEKMHLFADKILENDGVKFAEIDENSKAGKELLSSIKSEAVDRLGYFLKPSELFHKVAEKGAKSNDNFILGDLSAILKHIEASTMGHDSEDDFEGLFEDLDLGSSKLGKTESQKNELIAKVLLHLDKIDFRLSDTEADILGDAYEYLIGQFASGAGKKAGEYYTPQEVSTILAKIVTTGKSKIRGVYDPTCGSGSLLLRVAKEVDNVGQFFGQEMNPTTYNLARMNMILHGVHYQRFDLKNDDTLENPAQEHQELKFDAVVANPPFSAKWSANSIHLNDNRFSQYGILAPRSRADFAFVQHIVHHMDKDGICAIVLPHAALFRDKAERQIRKFLIDEKNLIDAVIGLPEKIFFKTDKPTCILVLKKRKENPGDILFIDASNQFERAAKRNQLKPKHIERIVNAYRERKSEGGFSSVVSLKAIQKNQYDLNISKYVEISSEQDPIDLAQVSKSLLSLENSLTEVDLEITEACKALGIPAPEGHNIPLMIEYKRGVMQLIFSQKIRFKDNSGKPFPDWKERKLSEFLTEHKESSTGREQVYSVSVHKGLVNQIEHLGRSYAATNTMHYNLVKPGDIVYTKSPTGDFPFGIIKQSTVQHNVIVSPLYGVFTPETKSLGLILNVYFELPANVHNYLYSIVHKGAKNTISITNKTFLSKHLKLPVSELEQAKIAEFLNAINKKIGLMSENAK